MLLRVPLGYESGDFVRFYVPTNTITPRAARTRLEPMPGEAQGAGKAVGQSSLRIQIENITIANLLKRQIKKNTVAKLLELQQLIEKSEATEHALEISEFILAVIAYDESFLHFLVSPFKGLLTSPLLKSARLC